VAADAARKRELLEEQAHAFFVLRLVRIYLRVRAFEIYRRQDARRAVARTGEEDGIEVVLVDQAIEVDVGEAQARARPPVAQETLLEVLGLQRFTEQRVASQVNHARGEVRAGPPVRVYLLKLVVRQRLSRHLAGVSRLRLRLSR
jgi:hypothetical protein